MLRIKPHQPQWHAVLFCGQAKPPRCSEIEPPWIAGDLSQNEGKVSAAQPLFQREQGIFWRSDFDMDQPMMQFWWKPMDIGPPGQA